MLAIFLINGSVKGQFDRSGKFTYPHFKEDVTGNLYLHLESNSFFQNDEYFGDFIEGYTLLGYSLQPSLMYYATPKLRLKAGIHVLKYDGVSDFTEAIPVFSAHLKLAKNLDLIMGALRGDIQHQLIDPLFDPENQYTRPVENGLQFLYKSERLKFDVWVDWDQFIFHGDSIPEKFTAGITNNLLLNNKESSVKIIFPFQFVARHIGGQISNYPEELKTLANIATGIKLESRVGEGFVREVDLQYWYLGYKDVTYGTGFDFNSGHAQYSTVNAQYKYGELMMGYWNGHNFMAAKGSSLFHSLSSRDYPYYRKNRQLITTKLSYIKEFASQLKFSAMFESYYDVEASDFEYAYGINLVFTPDFFIRNIQFE